MHGLVEPRRVRGAILAPYVGAGGLGLQRARLAKLNEIVRIPIIEYLVVFVLAGLFGLGIWIARRVRPTSAPAAPASHPA